jgi:hypothetical protein
MGRSSCTNENEYGCSDESGRNWVSENAWYDLVYRYSKSSEQSEGEVVEFPLLWLRVPDFTKNGTMTDIEDIPGEYDDEDDERWEEDSDCSGKDVDYECDLRMSEMRLIVYTPEDC